MVVSISIFVWIALSCVIISFCFSFGGKTTGISYEIIIVDSNSSDKTIEIAKSFGAKVFTEAWKGFGPQKNSVIDKCSGEWILLIDADEELSESLVSKIKKIINGKTDYNVYKINRSSVCFGKRIRYGGWSNQYAVRLWKKNLVKVNENLVHEDYLTEEKIGFSFPVEWQTPRK